MTFKELQELRDWSARKMGWIVENPNVPRWCQKFTPGSLVERVGDWKPDLDANQCFMLVERMRELGWWLRFTGKSKDELNEYAEFIVEKADAHNGQAWNPDFRLAILLAAKSTEN